MEDDADELKPKLEWLTKDAMGKDVLCDCCFENKTKWYVKKTYGILEEAAGLTLCATCAWSELRDYLYAFLRFRKGKWADNLSFSRTIYKEKEISSSPSVDVGVPV